jgi:DNA-binding transcriptional LysR family regulator
MNFRKLRYFCTIATEGSLSKAAEKLFVAQPALSRQLSELEEEVGTPLFNRQARGVALTAAGKSFLHDAAKILEDMEEAKSRALEAFQGYIGSLDIGLLEYFSWHTSVLRPIRFFREQHPGVSLKITTCETSIHMQEKVINGELDCGFGFNRNKDDKHLTGLPVLSVGFLLAVPANSPLAKRHSIAMHELADEPFVWIPRHISPVHYDRCLMMCNQAGFSPRITQFATNEGGRLSLVAAGVGSAIVTSSAAFWKPEQVSLLTLSDIDLKIDLDLVWRQDNPSPTLANFISAVKRSALRGLDECNNEPATEQSVSLERAGNNS